MKTAGDEHVSLPMPSEYSDHGRQWNCYPFVHQLLGDIKIGPRCEDQFTINPIEARNLAGALLAAAAYAEKDVAGR